MELTEKNSQEFKESFQKRARYVQIVACICTIRKIFLKRQITTKKRFEMSFALLA